MNVEVQKVFFIVILYDFITNFRPVIRKVPKIDSFRLHFIHKKPPTHLRTFKPKPDQEPIFRTFFLGKIPRKIPRKIPPPPKKKCWENWIFSAEKVSKNSFSKKFHRIFCGKSLSVEKNVQKIGRLKISALNLSLHQHAFWW
jgi:hypothetical protein